LFRRLGYCTQYDAFPKGATGRSFIASYLRVHGMDESRGKELAQRALERVGLVDAASRKVAGYSKGMRQRIKLAQAMAHDPDVLVLDEPLNGLDPMARAEMIELFRELAQAGRHLIISSHILHEVDLISDQVILLNEGYVVAEGNIRGVRSEMDDRPLQIMIRCDNPAVLAARVFGLDSVVEARIHDDGGGLLVSTKDASRFFLMLNKVVLDCNLKIESVSPADDDVHAVYQYLIGNEGDEPRRSTCSPRYQSSGSPSCYSVSLFLTRHPTTSRPPAEQRCSSPTSIRFSCSGFLCMPAASGSS
jgi:ABC-2 type transport system ATP-binding protein